MFHIMNPLRKLSLGLIPKSKSSRDVTAVEMLILTAFPRYYSQSYAIAGESYFLKGLGSDSRL